MSQMLILTFIFLADQNQSQPTFTQIAQWRAVLERMASFIRLIDFIVMELLRRLVQVSTTTLLALVKSSSVMGPLVKLGFYQAENVDRTKMGSSEIDFVQRNTGRAVEETVEALLKVELVLNVSQQLETPKVQTSKKLFYLTPLCI